MDSSLYGVHYENKLLSPSINHLFGTDAMGRDMFYRCVKGLSNSLVIGLIASVISSIVALVFGVLSAVFGGWFDRFVKLAVDLCMGLPHLVLLILISCLMGKGKFGVMVAVSLTHWPSLTRIVREEVLSLRQSQFVHASAKMGHDKTWIAFHHMVPHILPSYLIGLILLFPHAIMHEASVTFLGFGLSKETPAIGVILAESMNYITTGKWWMAVFPGIMLLIVVLLFDVIGENLKKLWNPGSGNE
ncbi:Dipeptide transport system permease protein DppC [Lachnospiraceae bacterium TWA4]|nr:Dipeptide transport system permease protein DppC [Lachnospiraceae bacterium TWA4]